MGLGLSGLTRLRSEGPGLALAFAAAGAAWAIDAATPAPMMLAALMIGLGLQPFIHPAFAPGVERASRFVLRLGVLLLGARITLGDIAGLGAPVASMTVAALVLAFAVGWWIARGLGLSAARAVLSSGAVAICGASATLALAAALPKDERTDRDAVAVVAVISIIGAIGMVAYPWLAHLAGLSDTAIGIYVGATLHEVAHVVGAGYAISDDAAATAATVKLLRIACMAPLVMLVAIWFRTEHEAGARPPLLPWFLIGFLALAALSSLGVTPAPVAQALGGASKWALAAALAAIGMKTSIARLAGAGPALLGAIVAQTLLLAGLVAWAMAVWPALRPG
jgi:uncharacterized integral membrane protein (TIGR00698 family)